MIFPAHALDVIFSKADGNFKQTFEIVTKIKHRRKTYAGTSDRLTYRPKPETSKVVVYIIDKSRYVEIVRKAVRETRLQLAREFGDFNYELVFLGIDNFDDDEYDLIGGFLSDKIRPDWGESDLFVQTIGEDHFDREYRYRGVVLSQFQEPLLLARIFGGTLKARLENISRGALTPVRINEKQIRLYDYRTAKKVEWPVNVANNTYVPMVDVSVPKYNFKLRYPDQKICLLILGGKEYSAVIGDAERLREETEVTTILDEMTNYDEVLLILGAFNFDWTEIEIVTQIIHIHSGGLNLPADKIFTCGYGMFNTAYLLNLSESTGFPQQPKSHVSELIKVLMGKEVEERAIKMHYSVNGWRLKKKAINVVNGRYIADDKHIGYTFQWTDYKIVFIVCDSTERNEKMDLRTVFESVEELKQSGIFVVVIETFDFELDDAHIIAEWIDYHRGVNGVVQNSDQKVIDSEQIAVLGSGIFDTIFQSKSTTYKTLLNTNKNQLKVIRDAYVKSGNGKRVFAARIDGSKFKVWTYPMNTVNGFYEPDLIPDRNMFDSKNGKKILFIITSGNLFNQVATLQNVDVVTLWLRGKIRDDYPDSDWSVFLVGLDNFGERDFHLFAELVERQTHDERSLDQFVSTFNYGISFPVYLYKDTRPFLPVNSSRIQSHVSTFFEMTNR